LFFFFFFCYFCFLHKFTKRPWQLYIEWDMNDSHLVGRSVCFCSIQSRGAVVMERLEQTCAVQSENGQMEVACIKPSHATSQLIWTLVSPGWEAWQWGQGWEDSVHKVLRPQTEKRVVSLQPFLADYYYFVFFQLVRSSSPVMVTCGVFQRERRMCCPHVAKCHLSSR